MGLDRIAAQQKQLQAEEVQRDKHERLRGSLECSGTEELRLLSARQSGALGRLASRHRAAKHDREVELRGKLARVKGGIARLWREHNKRCCGYGPRSNGADAGVGGNLSDAKSGRRPSLPSQQDSIVQTRKHDSSMSVSKKGHTTSRSRREEEAKGDGEEAAGTETENRVGPHGTASALSRTADGVDLEGGTAAASSELVSEEFQKTDEEVRTSSLLRLAAKSRRKPNRIRGGSLWRRKKRVNTAVTTDTEAVGDGYFGVLSTGEAHALAALGRGAPDDPRLLLSTSTLLAPLRRQRPESSTRAPLDAGDGDHVLGMTSGENGRGTGGDVDASGVYSRERGRTVVEGESRASDEYEVLDRAMEKLARKIEAEEDMSRRQLGMAPLSTM